ncbi:MAG: PIG-L family deacetylase [Pirellulaceae bacterium]
MSQVQPLDVIAVGAHPDDVEIGCGGTLAVMVGLGYRVGIVDLTDGEPTPGSPSPDVRIAEANEAARMLGVQERIILDLPNRRLFDSFEARVALAKVFRRFRPRLVIGLAERTPMASPDHWQATLLTEAAVFYSRLTKWDESFDGLPPHRISQLMQYELNFDVTTNAVGLSSFICDISATIEQKLQAVRCYKTQFPAEKQHVFERVTSMAKSFGVSAGFEVGERLFVPAGIGIADPMSLVRPRT